MLKQSVKPGSVDFPTEEGGSHKREVNICHVDGGCSLFLGVDATKAGTGTQRISLVKFTYMPPHHSGRVISFGGGVDAEMLYHNIQKVIVPIKSRFQGMVGL